MIEISPELDLDTLEGIDLVMSYDEIIRKGILRTDLKALLNFTKCPDLSSAVKEINTNKVLEIGTGDRFEALISLYQAMLRNDSNFSASDIWALDPKLDSGGVYPEQMEIVKKFTSRKNTIQDIKEEISGKFDLVLAKGVLSIGAGILNEPETVIDDILKAIQLSLNPNNKKASAIISSKTGLLLPFNTQTLIKAGLQPVYFMAPTREDLGWIRALNELGKIDAKPFKLVVCQRLQK